MRWLPHALVCSVFLASADFFVKLASNKISVNHEFAVVTTLVVSMPVKTQVFRLQKSDCTCPGGRCRGSRHYD